VVLQRRIEEVSLNSWPALQHILFDGWILRFSKGYTKRANSVNSLLGSSVDVNKKIDACERLYAGKGLPPIFRITPFSSPSDLDRVLEVRDYRKAALTSVLHLDLRNCPVQPVPAVELRHERLDDWMDVFYELSDASTAGWEVHRRILQAIPSRRLLASLAGTGRVVACGLGVLEGEYFGLFNLVTHPQWRNRGYGTKLVWGLLRWARDNGARHAYLQVVADNAPARRLYTKFGFREAYRYWYRILDDGCEAPVVPAEVPF
jgi:GNAT superfamily N-acetyltransferase